MIYQETIPFRSGYEQLFDILEQHNIPMLIFSATGLGYESIYYSLEKVGKLTDNITIISNAFIRDEQGKAIGINEPIIHTFNKDETAIHEFPIYQEISHRKNIILLGDSLGDTDMANGCAYENILKI